MTDQQQYRQIAENLRIVLEKAREVFTDSLAEMFKKKDVQLGPADKAGIEELFSDVFHTFICAELSAFIGYLVHNKYQKDDILIRIVPDFLDEYENMTENLPEALVEKTKQLAGMAKTVQETEHAKLQIIEKLLSDVETTADKRRLRASFDAVLLSMMGT